MAREDEIVQLLKEIRDKLNREELTVSKLAKGVGLGLVLGAVGCFVLFGLLNVGR